MWILSQGLEINLRRTLNPFISYAELFVDVHICTVLGAGAQLSSNSQKSSKNWKTLIQGT